MSVTLTTDMLSKLSHETQTEIFRVITDTCRNKPSEAGINPASTSAEKDSGKPLVLPAKTILTEIPVISPLRSEGPHPHNWPDHWNKMFKRPTKNEDQVIAGDTGSIGINYHLDESLSTVLSGTTTLESMIKRIVSHTKGRVNSRSAGYLSLFYEFGIQTTQPYFAIKKGNTGYWLAKKTSLPYWRNPSLPFDGILQNRFDFVIVRALCGDEKDMSDGDRYATIKHKKIEIPVIQAPCLDTSEDESSM